MPHRPKAETPATPSPKSQVPAGWGYPAPPSPRRWSPGYGTSDRASCVTVCETLCDMPIIHVRVSDLQALELRRLAGTLTLSDYVRGVLFPTATAMSVIESSVDRLERVTRDVEELSRSVNAIEGIDRRLSRLEEMAGL